MTYSDMPVIIPLLAAGYLLTIHLLLVLAQRTVKGLASPNQDESVTRPNPSRRLRATE